MKKHILLLHGALGCVDQFQELKRILSQQFEVHAFNFDGHGGTTVTKDFSIDLFTDNVHSFIRSHDLKEVYIFGYSMGGYVALNLEHKYPGSAQKIITLGTKFDWFPEFAAKEVKMLNPDKIEEKVPKFANYLEQLHGPENWKNVVLQTGNLMRNLGNQPLLDDQVLGSIQTEVVVLLGSLDTMVTKEESEHVSNLLPSSTLKEILDFPHQIEKVNKEQLASFITNIINN